MLVCFLVVSNAYDCKPHDRELQDPGQPHRHDVELSSLTAPSRPIRLTLLGIHRPGYLAVTGPSTGDGEATALWCRSLWLRPAARGKSKRWLHPAARCGPGLTDSAVRDDWQSNGNGENLQFSLSHVNRPSLNDYQGFQFLFWESHDMLMLQCGNLLFSCLYTNSKFAISQAETLRDTEILFTLIAAAALMETLITVLLSVELVLRPHAGQKWPMFKR